MNSHRQKILVIDDQYMIADCVSQALSSFGYEVFSADSGEKGLSVFSEERCHLIITDYSMPGMNGIDVACRVKDFSPSTPVVLMTGLGEAEIRSGNNQAVFDRILFKPFSMAEMKEAVETLLPSFDSTVPAAVENAA